MQANKYIQRELRKVNSPRKGGTKKLILKAIIWSIANAQIKGTEILCIFSLHNKARILDIPGLG